MKSETGHDGELQHRFTYHSPPPEAPEVFKLVRDTGRLAAEIITAATPPSRELSLAITKLEEAVMWANAAIARRGLSSAGNAGAVDLLDRALNALGEDTSSLLGYLEHLEQLEDDPEPTGDDQTAERPIDHDGSADYDQGWPVEEFCGARHPHMTAASPCWRRGVHDRHLGGLGDAAETTVTWR